MGLVTPPHPLQDTLYNVTMSMLHHHVPYMKDLPICGYDTAGLKRHKSMNELYWDEINSNRQLNIFSQTGLLGFVILKVTVF